MGDSFMIEVNYMICHEDPSDIICGFVSELDYAGGNSIEYMDGTHEEIDGSQIKPIKSGAGFNPAIIGITLFVIAMILVSIYFMM